MEVLRGRHFEVGAGFSLDRADALEEERTTLDFHVAFDDLPVVGSDFAALDLKGAVLFKPTADAEEELHIIDQ